MRYFNSGHFGHFLNILLKPPQPFTWLFLFLWVSSIVQLFDFLTIDIYSSGSSGWVRGGLRKMKSMQLPLAAIFFMTNFYRARGGHGPLSPPGSATDILHITGNFEHSFNILTFDFLLNPFPARGFVNSISSSTTCFSVMEELFDGIA